MICCLHFCACSLVAGGAASRVDPDAAGINPAWRKAAVHIVGGATWADGTTSDEINALRAALSERNAQLRALAPESGAYFNEVRAKLCWASWRRADAPYFFSSGVAIRTGLQAGVLRVAL